MAKSKQRIVIRHKWALGDTILLTALIRDIHKAYPNQYDVGVDTHWTNVWWNNPYVTKFDNKGGPKPQVITTLNARPAWTFPSRNLSLTCT
jgi:hypothetical protein